MTYRDESLPRIVPAPHGDDIITLYHKRTDVDGNSTYIPRGEMDIQSDIDSYETGCSLKAILDRCSLMPTEDKVRYLQQNMNGVYVDVSSMPKDGTAARIMVDELKLKYPRLGSLMNEGKSFDECMKIMFCSKTNESEVSTDGEVQSSDD